MTAGARALPVSHKGGNQLGEKETESAASRGQLTAAAPGTGTTSARGPRQSTSREAASGTAAAPGATVGSGSEEQRLSTNLTIERQTPKRDFGD